MAAPLYLGHLSSHGARLSAIEAVKRAPAEAQMRIDPPKRTLRQNNALHGLLTDIAAQVEWAGSLRSVEAWKDILTAALRSANHSLDVVPGINGGFVLLGMHTSSMSREELSDLITLAIAFGDGQGVRWSPKMLAMIEGRDPSRDAVQERAREIAA